MSLKVGVDASPLSGHIVGIGRYVFEICRELEQQLPEAQFFLYSRTPIGVELPSERWIARDEHSWWITRTPSSYFWLKAWVRKMAEADGVDVFWATRTILPGKSKAFKTVSTVHDLNYLLFPKTMPFVTLQAHRLWFSQDVHRADIVVTNSQGTADRLNEMLEVNAGAVIRPGVASDFVPQSPDICTKYLAKLGVKKPYFLAVGTLEPRKNLLVLIEAFLDLKHSGELADYELLLSGNKGWGGTKLYTYLEQAESKGVRWLGFVSDQELAVLYTAARAFVFPSVYEGFGIPALEARACGATVVASNLPELHESAGTEAIYVTPTVEGIRGGMLTALEAPVPQPVVDAADWSNAAQKMALILRSLSSS